jgi:hypothetical protein
MLLKKKLYYGYKKQQKPVKRKILVKKNIKEFLNNRFTAKLFKKNKYNFKAMENERLDTFFKLLFLIPRKQIKLLKRLLKILFYLRIELRAFLLLKISKVFKKYFKKYLKNLQY